MHGHFGDTLTGARQEHSSLSFHIVFQETLFPPSGQGRAYGPLLLLLCLSTIIPVDLTRMLCLHLFHGLHLPHYSGPSFDLQSFCECLLIPPLLAFSLL